MSAAYSPFRKYLRGGMRACYTVPMITITSVSNPTIQRVRRLKDKQARDAEACFIVEGANILRDLGDRMQVEQLFVVDTRMQEYADILAKPCMPKPQPVSDKVMRAMSDTTTPCGILAVLAKPVCDTALQGNVLVLDHVSDPGNMGTIFRTGVACGTTDIVLIGGADPYSPKVVRSSMGAVLRLRLHSVAEENCASLLSGRCVLALDMHGDNLYRMSQVDTPWALVVGNEAHGISDTVRGFVDRIVSLPMTGDIESLNAAISCSIAAYHLTFSRPE